MTKDQTQYDTALSTLVGYGPTYRGGFANHVPMALDALNNLGYTELFEPLLAERAEMLELARNEVDIPTSVEIESVLRDRLPQLVSSAGSQAGHGLLRVVHAIRAWQQSKESEVRRKELILALEYWADGAAPHAPLSLQGSGRRDLLTTFCELESVAMAPRDSFANGVRSAAALPSFRPLVESLGPTTNGDALASRFDELALLSAAALIEVAPRGLGDAMGLLHGATVPTMAGHIVKYLDEPARGRLESAVAAFCFALASAYSSTAERAATAERLRSPGIPGRAIEETEARRLAFEAAKTLDDHSIKFAEVSLRQYLRSGNQVFITALAAWHAAVTRSLVAV